MHLEVNVEVELTTRERRFSLQVAFNSDEQRVVIFGPSGAGKSVTIQSIAGLLHPKRGRVVLGDRVLFDSTQGIDLPARERQVGYLFQDYALFPHLNVADNVGFALRRWPWPLTLEQRERVQQYLELLEIAHLARSLPRELSGGQRQRVALARALICNPQILLLDEPFAALDVLLRQRMREELSRLQEQLSIPLVVITHDPEDVRTFAETLVIYTQGRVEQVVGRGRLRREQGEDYAWQTVREACHLAA